MHIYKFNEVGLSYNIHLDCSYLMIE